MSGKSTKSTARGEIRFFYLFFFGRGDFFSVRIMKERGEELGFFFTNDRARESGF